MTNIRLSKALCAVVGNVLSTTGSHTTLDSLFKTAGVPGYPPDLPHTSKWKTWLFRAGNDQEVDSLTVLGNVLEEFMDLAPDKGSEFYEDWEANRTQVISVLEENGLRYFRGGRILPNGETVAQESSNPRRIESSFTSKPSDIEELLLVLIKGLRRAMHPFTHRRKGAQLLKFSSEYDVQDLLHALLRPWVADIRPEEFTPSYAGSSTRMDFLLPAHELVIELKFVRDRSHAKKIGDELIIDIEHYNHHPNCQVLWCVIYDQDSLLINAEGLMRDLEGERVSSNRTLLTRVEIL